MQRQQPSENSPERFACETGLPVQAYQIRQEGQEGQAQGKQVICVNYYCLPLLVQISIRKPEGRGSV